MEPATSASTDPSERTDRGYGEGEPERLSWLARLGCSIVKAGPTPQHVAFIMDGNRRFARNRGWQVEQGHRLGYDKLEEALRWCCELGVRGVTVYAFAIDNFNRSTDEVRGLMALCEEKLRAMSDETNVVQRRGVRVRVVGDLSRVSDSLRSEMRRVMRMTQRNTRHTLTVCFSYAARNEIAGAVRRLSEACAEGKLLPADVSEDLLERCLLTSGAGSLSSPVDLIVRTSGEKRLSDFLLWQSATCAVAFTPVLWPELSLLRFLALILDFQRVHPYLRAIGAPGGAAAAAGAPGGAGGGAAARACQRGWLGPLMPRADGRALRLVLLVLVLGSAAAAACAGARWAAEGRTRPPLTLAAACAAAWLLLGLACPVGGERRAQRAGSDAEGKGGLAACPEPSPATPASEASARRTRDFIADVSVDRRL